MPLARHACGASIYGKRKGRGEDGRRAGSAGPARPGFGAVVKDVDVDIAAHPGDDAGAGVLPDAPEGAGVFEPRMTGDRSWVPSG